MNRMVFMIAALTLASGCTDQSQVEEPKSEGKSQVRIAPTPSPQKQELKRESLTERLERQELEQIREEEALRKQAEREARIKLEAEEQVRAELEARKRARSSLQKTETQRKIDDVTETVQGIGETIKAVDKLVNSN